MHSKLQLLKYPSYMRIAIPTGNLVPYVCSPSFRLTHTPSKSRLTITQPTCRRDSADKMQDWGETGVMENSVFIIDLPRIEDKDKREQNQLTAFGEDLCYFLQAQGLDDTLTMTLRNYDFTETSRYAFVHSM